MQSQEGQNAAEADNAATQPECGALYTSAYLIELSLDSWVFLFCPLCSTVSLTSP